MNLRVSFLLCLLCFACGKKEGADMLQEVSQNSDYPYIVVLGIAQDGGFPHINNPAEFEEVASGFKKRENVVSLGLIDPIMKKKYLFEATPDLPSQLNHLASVMPGEHLVDGIFLTHAHMGHYTGLMHLGREAFGGNQIPVYAMPKMESFLTTHGPWSQLVSLENIKLVSQQANQKNELSKQLYVTPFLVPHRDEFSETVGYTIAGPNRSVLFIPDINKWSAWDRSILEEVNKVDFAFIDATFYAEGEIPRPMSEVPHPFIEETVRLFAEADFATRSKLVFIHFNHSNPLLDQNHPQRIALEKEGFRFAKEGDMFSL
jgi:pyrroloquinoline quinone biosynthesis protein B